MQCSVALLAVARCCSHHAFSSALVCKTQACTHARALAHLSDEDGSAPLVSPSGTPAAPLSTLSRPASLLHAWAQRMRVRITPKRNGS